MVSSNYQTLKRLDYTGKSRENYFENWIQNSGYTYIRCSCGIIYEKFSILNEFNKEIYEFKNCNKCNKIIEINGVKFENIIQALNNE